MPSLMDTLADLSAQSSQISQLSSLNTRPAGPFVTAYLQLSPHPQGSGTVLDLIRDAQESEVRLFKFIGESDGVAGPGAGGGTKKVEKRDGVVVTPVRELKSHKGKGRDEVDVMLRTALKLVDDYRPMPRARAYIAGLLEAHLRQADLIAEFERQISEAENPASKLAAPTQTSVEPSDRSDKPQLSPDEAIRAEEEAIRALEASLASLRRATTKDTPDSPPTSSRSPADSPPPVDHAETMRTPARPTPKVTNSLVNGTTPHRTAPRTMDRFSPLRFLGTPRANVGQPSGLRSVIKAGEGDEQRTIFAKRALTRSVGDTSKAPVTPVALQHEVDDRDADESDEAGDDQTVRYPAPLSPSPAAGAATESPVRASEGDKVIGETTSRASPTKPPADDASTVEGVDVQLDTVQDAVNKIWSTLSELMGQGLADGQTLAHSAEDGIKHLNHLARSDPPPPPSPSNASSLSSLSSIATAAAAKAPPITSQTIMLAHLCLLLLRSASPDSPEASASMSEVKESLTSMARARGWDGAEDMGTKIVYAAVGKRVIRIDRRGGAGGTVRFAD